MYIILHYIKHKADTSKAGSQCFPSCLECSRFSIYVWWTELNWRETERKCPGKGRGGLSSQHSVDDHSIEARALFHTVWRVPEARSVHRQKATRGEENVCFSFLSTNLSPGPWASLVVQVTKNLPASAGDGKDAVWSLGWEDILEKERANQYFLPGKLHGQRSLEGYSPWDCKEGSVKLGVHTSVSIQTVNVSACPKDLNTSSSSMIVII